LHLPLELLLLPLELLLPFREPARGVTGRSIDYVLLAFHLLLTRSVESLVALSLELLLVLLCCLPEITIEAG
jgi:hypothetical protein